MKGPGQGKIQIVMSGNVFHIPAMGEQIINFTKIGIINNLGNSSLGNIHEYTFNRIITT